MINRRRMAHHSVRGAETAQGNKGAVIRSEEVVNEGFCRMMCYMEPNCVSINVKPLQGGKY